MGRYWCGEGSCTRRSQLSNLKIFYPPTLKVLTCMQCSTLRTHQKRLEGVQEKSVNLLFVVIHVNRHVTEKLLLKANRTTLNNTEKITRPNYQYWSLYTVYSLKWFCLQLSNESIHLADWMIISNDYNMRNSEFELAWF